jgi:hypothetical protein
MKKFSRILAAAVVLAMILVILASCGENESAIVGTWRREPQEINGVAFPAFEYIFFDDDTCTIVGWGIWEGTYSIEGNTLKLNDHSEFPYTALYEFKIDGKELTLIGKGGAAGTDTFILTKQ